MWEGLRRWHTAGKWKEEASSRTLGLGGVMYHRVPRQQEIQIGAAGCKLITRELLARELSPAHSQRAEKLSALIGGQRTYVGKINLRGPPVKTFLSLYYLPWNLCNAVRRRVCHRTHINEVRLVRRQREHSQDQWGFYSFENTHILFAMSSVQVLAVWPVRNHLNCAAASAQRKGVINSHFHRQQHPAQQEARSRTTGCRSNSFSFQVKLLKAASFLFCKLPLCVNQQWGRHAKSLHLVILVWFQQIHTKTTNARCVRSI